MTDPGVNAVEVVQLFFLMVAVFVGTGANAFTNVDVVDVVEATNPNAEQMAIRVNFIVC